MKYSMRHRVCEDEYQHFDEPVVPGSEKSLHFVIKGTKWDDGRFDMCLTDGFGEKQTVVYRNGGAKHVHYNMAKYRKRDGSVFIRVRNWKDEWIDFGDHTVVGIEERTVGVSSVPTLVDENGLINFLNGEGGLTFDSDHWIESKLEFSKDSTYSGRNTVKVQCGDEYNLVNTMDFTLVFPEWSSEMVSYSTPSGYPKMRKFNNDKYIPSEGCIFMRRSDGKIDAVSINTGIAFILTEGLDDVFVSAASYVYALSGGKLFLVGWKGNSIECEGVMGTGEPDRLFMKADGMWRVVVLDMKYVGIGGIHTACRIMKESSEYFEGIYEKCTKFPVVMRDGKFNYLDLQSYFDTNDYESDGDSYEESDQNNYLLSDIVGTKWFDDVEPVEVKPNEFIFRVELDGERKVYVMDSNYQVTERDPED